MLKSSKLTALLERQFQIQQWRDRIEDDRPNPKIPPATIAQMVAEMPLRGQTSMLEVDQDMREEENILWHGAEERNYPMAASDSTIFRSLEGMDLSAIKSILQETAERFLNSPRSKVHLPSGRKVRVGAVDGTHWGRYPGSVLTILGGGVADQVANYRLSPGKGHELSTSRAVEETACRRFGKGYIDYLAKDALYVTESDMKRARKNGYDLVVKTEDNSLNIIKKARSAFYYRLKRTPMDLKEVKGIDAERGCSYKITCTAELTWQGQEVKVAHIKETCFNPKSGHPEQTDYWVITTDLEMDPHDMREVKILRWRYRPGNCVCPSWGIAPQTSYPVQASRI